MKKPEAENGKYAWRSVWLEQRDPGEQQVVSSEGDRTQDYWDCGPWLKQNEELMGVLDREQAFPHLIY